jgi:hypothetical protein
VKQGTRLVATTTRVALRLVSGTNTVVNQNQPPTAFLNAYQNVLDQAQGVSSRPLQQYSAPMVSGFTPDQQAAMGIVRNSQGVANPYINAAAQEFGAATAASWNLE